MYLTELVLQGIGGFATPRKLTIKPGFNVFLGGKNSGKSIIAEAISSLFYPISFERNRSFVQNTSQGASRAGIGFEYDKRIYRKVADFTQGLVSLSRLKEDQSAYETLSQDQNQIHEFFVKYLKLPHLGVYRVIFCSWPGEFPSNKSAEITHSGIQQEPSSDPQMMVRELQSLRKLKDDALKIKEIQFELDGLHKEIFELEDVLKKTEELRSKLEEEEKDIKTLGVLPEIPDDFETRVDKYEVAARKRNAEVPYMEQELHHLKEEAACIPLVPLQQDIQFLLGVGLLVSTVLSGVITAGWEQIAGMSIQTFHFFLGVLAITGLGFLAIRLFKFFTFRDKEQGFQKEIRLMSERLKNTERKFEVETSVIRNIMRVLEVDTVREMEYKITELQKAHTKRNEIAEKLEIEESKPSWKKSQNQLPEMKDKAKKMDHELQLLSATPLDLRALEEQILELERRAEQSGANLSDSKTSSSAGEDWLKEIPDDFIQKIGTDFFYHPFFKLIAVAAYAFDMNIQEFLGKLLPPLDKNLVAFSFKNISQPHIDLDGTFSVHDVELKSRTRFEQLEVFKQDLVYFALKFTILQFLLRQNTFPLVFDSAFRLFDERIGSVLAKSLKFLSQENQILLLTDQEYYAQAADHVQRL